MTADFIQLEMFAIFNAVGIGICIWGIWKFIYALAQEDGREEGKMRLKEHHKRDLKKAIEELTAEYNKAVENDYEFKPMAYTLYHLWQKWDEKEYSRISNT